jgi:signal transduction histidine kinase
MSRRPGRTAQAVEDGTALEQERAAWEKERERLLSMLSQQQRVAQTGLTTAGLVHEIANQVMLVQGLAFMALRSRDPVRWRENLQQIQARCDDISDTMRTVLDFVGRRAEGDLETFRASDIVAGAARLVRPLAMTKSVGIERRVEQDAVLVGERRMLVQALVNLVSNAIRACDGQPGCVRLGVTCTDERRCVIEVEDDGLGIPEALRPRLFRPFVTGHAGSGGSGLGLFVVRQVVRRMGGTIRVRTSPGGTSVRLDLPSSGPPGA